MTKLKCNLYKQNPQEFRLEMLENTMTETSLFNGNLNDLRKIVNSSESRREEKNERATIPFFQNKMYQKNISENAQINEKDTYVFPLS